jgi:hypothetical protein
MLGDAVIRSKRPHELQLLDVIGNSFGGVAIGVIHNDVLCMTLVKVFPLLAGVDMEVEVVEVGQVFCQRCRTCNHETGSCHERQDVPLLRHDFPLSLRVSRDVRLRPLASQRPLCAQEASIDEAERCRLHLLK